MSFLGSRTHSFRGTRAAAPLGLTLVIAALVAMTLGSGSPAGAAELSLAAFYNNVGIQQDPMQGSANFDGGGYNYSAHALQLGDPANGYPGVTPGQKITAGGFSFTWPARPAGQPDNVQAKGQTIPVGATTTKLGFLGSATNGPAGGTFVFNYVYTDEFGVEQRKSVSKPVTFTDWTRGLAGDGALAPNNTVVLKNLFRTQNPGTLPLPTQPHIFLVTTSVDPTMTLESIKLPIAPSIHIFGLATQ